MRAAIYRRVSTASQDVETHAALLRDRASAEGWVVVADLADVASGVDGPRPRYRSLEAMVKARQVDVVLVWRLDRLGRSLRQFVTFLDDCRTADVRVVGVNDGVDTGTPTGRLLGELVGIFAAYEATIIRERTMAGLQRARQRGSVLGRPRRQLDRAAAQEAFQRLGSERLAAAALGVSRSTLRRRLRAPEEGDQP